MMPSTKMIEKLKHGFHGLERATEPKADEPSDTPLSYLMDYITPAMQEEAKTKLNETEENRTRGLEELRRLIKKDEKLLTPTDDNFLMAFLRSRKFNSKKAFRLLQNYWSFRKEHKSIYDTSDSCSVKRLILKNIVGFLPHRDRSGSVVMIFKVGKWEPDKDVYEEMFRAITAILIHSIQYPATQIAGYRIIMDVRGLSWAQLRMCTPANILLMVHSTQMMLHGSDVQPLSEFIHPSVLPDEYGGTAGPFENSKWVEILEASTDHVMGMLNYGYQD